MMPVMQRASRVVVGGRARGWRLWGVGGMVGGGWWCEVWLMESGWADEPLLLMGG